MQVWNFWLLTSKRSASWGPGTFRNFDIHFTAQINFEHFLILHLLSWVPSLLKRAYIAFHGPSLVDSALWVLLWCKLALLLRHSMRCLHWTLRYSSKLVPISVHVGCKPTTGPMLRVSKSYWSIRLWYRTCCWSLCVTRWSYSILFISLLTWIVTMHISKMSIWPLVVVLHPWAFKLHNGIHALHSSQSSILGCTSLSMPSSTKSKRWTQRFLFW